jgi:hypothetical protein
VLVLFAGGFTLVLLIAALVFDVGQNLLDRRAEQNAADAAALAGARWVQGAGSFHDTCAVGLGSGNAAVRAACEVAAANGYVHGSDNKTVKVDLPPVAPSVFSGLPGHIQVTIGSTRPSFFQGILGVVVQRTGAMGVATNASDISLPYSLLSLAPHACGENKITGSPGSYVSTNGTVHVDSDCSSAILLSGNGVLTAPECDVVGDIQTSGGATNNCTSAPDGILVSGDPLRNMPPPAQPAAPAAVQPLDAGPIPAGCPGGSAPATDATPTGCAFTSGLVDGKTYRLFPGNYPGGIRTSKATLYLSPGIYWLGGGGLQVQTTGRLISKAVGDDSGLTASGGVLLFDTADPDPTIAAACVSTPTGPGCFAGISLNGGPGAAVALLPIQSGDYKNMVIYVDRNYSITGDEIFLNGADSTLMIRGTVYAPNGSIRFNGSDSYADVSAQLICWTFQVNGSGAGLTIDYDPSQVFHLKGSGLVE